MNLDVKKMFVCLKLQFFFGKKYILWGVLTVLFTEEDEFGCEKNIYLQTLHFSFAKNIYYEEFWQYSPSGMNLDVENMFICIQSLHFSFAKNKKSIMRSFDSIVHRDWVSCPVLVWLSEQVKQRMCRDWHVGLKLHFVISLADNTNPSHIRHIAAPCWNTLQIRNPCKTYIIRPNTWHCWADQSLLIMIQLLSRPHYHGAQHTTTYHPVLAWLTIHLGTLFITSPPSFYQNRGHTSQWHQCCIQVVAQ